MLDDILTKIFFFTIGGFTIFLLGWMIGMKDALGMSWYDVLFPPNHRKGKKK